MKLYLQEFGSAEKKSKAKVRAWAYVVVMLLWILISLPLTPFLWHAAVQAFGSGFEIIGYVVLSLLVLGFALYMISHHERYDTLSFGLIVLLAVAYFYLLKYQCPFPAERLHLIEYGLLAYLFYRAVRLDFPNAKSYALGFLFSSAFGFADEVIQHFLPNRVFELRDVMTNIIASALGLVVVAIVLRQFPHAVPSRGEE